MMFCYFLHNQAKFLSYFESVYAEPENTKTNDKKSRLIYWLDLQGRTNLPETISNPNIKLEIERGRALGTLWSLRPKQVLILQEIMLNHPKVTKQSELAEKFAVGRNTVNEIINQLSFHGFVQRKKGKPNIYSMELTELVMNLIADSIDEEFSLP